jgi:serine/threonine protein kinase, bacterial
MKCPFMKRISYLCPLWLALCCWQAKAQIYDTNNVVVQTFAGSGFSGYLDGVGQQTMFNYPSKVAGDSSGNLFVLDGGNARIRKITSDGTVSTYAGGGAGSLPGYGTSVS